MVETALEFDANPKTKLLAKYEDSPGIRKLKRMIKSKGISTHWHQRPRQRGPCRCQNGVPARPPPTAPSSRLQTLKTDLRPAARELFR